jgi:hypothetical protein
MGGSVVVVDAAVAGVVVGPSVVDDEDTAVGSVEVVAVVVGPSVVDDEDTAATSVVTSPPDSGDPLQLDKATRTTIASHPAQRMSHLSTLFSYHCHCPPGAL